MKKKRYVLLLLMLPVAGIFNASAQTLDDFGKIALKVQVADKKMPDEAKIMLENKMKQIITHFGIGSTDASPRFVIEAKVDVLNKDITATAPQRFSQKLEISFYVGDAIKQRIFSSVPITCTGIGTNETKSFIAALRQINPQNEKFKSFIEEGKNEIITYYKTECAQILKETESLAQRGKYGEAIYHLALIPDVCADCYEQGLKLQSKYFTQKIETEGKALLTQAKAIWAEQPNGEGAAKIARLIPQINPQVSFIQDVHSFTNEISAVVQEQELREW
ncbi:MAG: hypothetical protein LBK58_15520 [Prevotellaceae bacterium]|jgi:hypothetical protein|nr:hypothetical protein [Prevotellaceae bacterium]